jgi:putative aminopeptidase FrvX
MDFNRLKEILSIPTYFGEETLMIEYVEAFAKEHGFKVVIDSPKRNVLITKGELDDGEFYPCVSAHMDTVYNTHCYHIYNNQRLTIREDFVEIDSDLIKVLRAEGTGIGGDDKCGVAICLELLLKCDKIKVALFVEEEFGCHGARVANKEFFDNVGYLIEFDAPTNNWCSEVTSGVKLYNESLFNELSEIFNKHEITNFSIDPYTDVAIIRNRFDFCCLNFSAGYYLQHGGAKEFVIPEHVEQALNLGVDIIEKLGYTKKYFRQQPPTNGKEISLSF